MTTPIIDTSRWPKRLVDPDDEAPADVHEAIHAELVYLWEDLAGAVRAARNGAWSVGCESLTHRIVALSRAAGAGISWRFVDIGLVRAGVYQRINDEAGLPFLPVDWDELAEAGRVQSGGDR